MNLLFVLFAVAALVNGIWYASNPLHAPERSTHPVSEGVNPAEGCTVLLCARNEADNLRHNLPLLFAQRSDLPFEVLVVDDASTDDTPEVLSFFQKQYSALRVLRLPEKKQPGKKNALASGIAAAKYELLLCTDADCAPTSSLWLSAMTKPLRENSHIALVLGYAPMKRSSSTSLDSNLWLNRWIRFETAHIAWTYCAFAQAGLPYMGVGRNLAWRKHLWAQTGGFAGHEHIPSGDDDLFVSAAATYVNTAICLAPEAFMFSEGKKTWGEWYAQKRRHLSTGAYYRPHHRFMLGMLALAHCGHYAALSVLSCTGWAVWAWAIWGVRMIVVWRSWANTLKVLKEPGLLVWTPLLDALLGVYFGTFGLVLAGSRRWHKW